MTSAWDDSLSDDDLVEPPEDNKPQRLLWASQIGKLDIVRDLCLDDRSLIHSKDEHDYTALHFAASEGHLEIVEFLLPLVADPNPRTSDGWTPLHNACKWNHVEVAHLLIQNDADINATSDGNVTPLHVAAGSKGAAKLLVLLLSNRKINPKIRNNAGDTAYDIAKRTDQYDSLFGMVANSVLNF